MVISKCTIALTLSTVMLAAGVASPSPQVMTFKTLFNFQKRTGGQYPGPALIQATDGNFYGTTDRGGTNGGGTVFKITPGGTLTTLHSFAGTDGESPEAGLIQATDGNFYGTTYEGGRHGFGTVFRMTPDGTVTTLHSLTRLDGTYPEGELVQGNDGDFYGTTFDGGENYTCGTVFKITPSGSLKTLHSFDDSDGCGPRSALIQGNNGEFYGTTEFGGAYGSGEVFEITRGGTVTVLYSFCVAGGNCADGSSPYGTLLQASDGDLYGTTYYGGTQGVGTVFKITSGGTFATLHSFDDSDGGNPYAALIQATNGELYGAAGEGGANDDGTVFAINRKSSALVSLHSFDDSDGQFPGGLMQATDGKFYGVADEGGLHGYGTVFSLSIGLEPFVKTQTSVGSVGAGVNILGTELTGASKVTFNGVAAVFTVVSASLITTTVPSGATTGLVEVTTPAGILKSNKKFRVTQ